MNAAVRSLLETAPVPDVTIRPAMQGDLELLWRFLATAAYEPDIATAKAIPFVAAHVADWQRPEDFGFVAERAGVAIGATWARQFSREEEPPFFVDDRTPEVTIGVAEEARGLGIGGTLLDALKVEAERRGVGLCLNVRHDNPAQRLYRRLGFRMMGSAMPNRVGGLSLGMVLDRGA